MVLRVRIRSGKLAIDHNGVHRMSSYVVAKGDGNKFRTVTDKDGGKEPVWQQTLSFHNNPLRLRLQVWVEHPNGDIMIGEVDIDLTQFYQRQAYRIEPKLLSIGDSKRKTGQIKLQLDFDFEGTKQNLINQIKQVQNKNMKHQQHKKKQKETDLHVGTVLALGNKKAAQINEIKKQQQMYQNQIFNQQKPYQKPPTGNNNHNQIPKHQQRYDYEQKNHNEFRKAPHNQHWNNKKGNNLFQVIANNVNNQNQGRKKPQGNGWDL